MHYKKVLIDLKQFWLKPIPNYKIDPRPKDRGNFYPYKSTHDLKIVAIFTHTTHDLKIVAFFTHIKRPTT